MTTHRVRAYYARLGVTLGRGGQHEASTRCFLNPDVHRCEDRHPSCSVNLHTGAFYCHGCAQGGGAYDAATALGLSPREAIDLMVDFGLTERRHLQTGQPVPARSTGTSPPARHREKVQLNVSELEIANHARALRADAGLLQLLRVQRRWHADVLRTLQIGHDGRRVTIPARDRDGRLLALLRYDPGPVRRGPKILAAPGSRRALFPAPETLHYPEVVLCEGEPDALAGRSAGLPAIAIPGAGSWRPEWAWRFAGRRVLVCFDCDWEGRTAAAAATCDLTNAGARTTLIDLDPARGDGWDLTDALLAHPARCLPAELADVLGAVR